MNSQEYSKILARHLLQIKAVRLSLKQPFQWASGLLSPIYCDNRVTLSYPAIRTFIRQQFVETIENHFSKPEYIAGVATGGIAQGVLVAQEMNLPYIYVRPEPKSHGLQNQIEGFLKPNSKVVVIEDLVSTGKSSLLAIQAILDAGGSVAGLVSIFTYNFPDAHQAFNNIKIPYRALTDFDTLINVAAEENYIENKDIDLLKEWKKDPKEFMKTFFKKNN